MAFWKGLLAAVISGVVTAIAEYLQAHGNADLGHVQNAAAIGAAVGVVGYLWPNPAQGARIAQLLNRIELMKMGVKTEAGAGAATELRP